MSGEVTFWDCVVECARTPSFLAEIDRLASTKFSTFGERPPIVQMIDEATGHDRAMAMQFLWIVWEVVYSRIPKEKQP